jgi:hypothetical protein
VVQCAIIFIVNFFYFILFYLFFATQMCIPHSHSIQLDTHGITPIVDICNAHRQQRHHFFISYRVATEGKQVEFHVWSFIFMLLYIFIYWYNMQEPEKGLVQMVYEKMAVQRGSDRQPLYSFWDKKCLNLGQDWETGFLHALLNSRVIVLLISNKVCTTRCH